MAIDPDGNATAVWVYDGADGLERAEAVQSSYRPASGLWQAPVDVSVPGESTWEPSIATNSHGFTAAIWSRYAGPNERVVQAAVRRAGHDWQAPVNVQTPSTSEEDEGWYPRIAVDRQGNATAVWALFRNGVSSGGKVLIQASYRPYKTGAWQTPVTLSELGGRSSGQLLELAVNADGYAVATWRGEDALLVASRPLGGSWQPPEQLATAAAEPAVAVHPKGNTMILWEGTEPYDVKADYRRASTGIWQTPVVLSTNVPGNVAVEPHVGFASSGRAIAIWRSYDGKNDVVQGAFRPRNTGIWETPVNLSEAGEDAVSPNLAVNSKGYAVAIWDRYNGSYEITQSSTRTPGLKGVWRTPVNLSGRVDTQFPAVALNPLGNGMAVWEVGNGYGKNVQASALVPPL